MLRKILLFVVATMLSVISCAIVYANYVGTIQATRVQYPIIIDNTSIEKDIPMISIEDRIYLPIRAMCEVLGLGIEWKEKERQVEIVTDNSVAENEGIEIGYYGIEGWISVDLVEFAMTKETAVIIADDIFLQIKGETFLTETVIGIDETDDGKCYSVYRYTEPIEPGEDLSIIIRKSDGKVLRVVAGE